MDGEQAPPCERALDRVERGGERGRVEVVEDLRADDQVERRRPGTPPAARGARTATSGSAARRARAVERGLRRRRPRAGRRTRSASRCGEHADRAADLERGGEAAALQRRDRRVVLGPLVALRLEAPRVGVGRVEALEVARRGPRLTGGLAARPGRAARRIGSSRCWSTNSSKSRRARSSGVPVANGREPGRARPRRGSCGRRRRSPRAAGPRAAQVGRRRRRPPRARASGRSSPGRSTIRPAPSARRSSGSPRARGRRAPRRRRRRPCPPRRRPCGSRRARTTARAPSSPGAPSTREHGRAVEAHAVALGRAHAAGAVPGAVDLDVVGEVDVDQRGGPAAGEQHERAVEPAGAASRTPSRRASAAVAVDERRARPRPGAGSAPQTPSRPALADGELRRSGSAAAPLDAVEVALEDPPDRAVRRRRRAPRPLLRARGRRRQRAGVSQRLERRVGEGGVRVELGGAGGDRVEHVAAARAVTPACLPREAARDSRGTASGQSRAAAPARVRARAAARRAARSARRSPARPRAARPAPRPSWASTIAPCVELGRRRASRRRRRRASRACRRSSRRCPAPRSAASARVKSADAPTESATAPAGRRASSASSAGRGRRPPPRAGLAGGAGGRSRGPRPRDPAATHPPHQVRMRPTRSAEHEERRLHAAAASAEHRGGPARVGSVIERQREHDPRQPTHALAPLDCASLGGRSSVGRAPGCGPGGRGFESRRSPLKKSLQKGFPLQKRTSRSSATGTDWGQMHVHLSSKAVWRGWR